MEAEHHQQQLEFQEYQEKQNHLLAKMFHNIDMLKVYEDSEFFDGQVRYQLAIQNLINSRDEYDLLNKQFWGSK